MAKEKLDGCTITSEQLKPMPRDVFIIIGPPTSGKSTQSLYLAETIRSPILKGKEILPEASDELEPTRTLIPDSEFLPVLAQRLELTTGPHLVLDNIPRTPAQAKLVSEWANRNRVQVHVVRLMLTEDEVVDRASGRLVCPECGESYHSFLKPSQKPGVCDKDNTTLDKRKGDDPNALRKGFKEHDSLDSQLATTLQDNGAVIHSIPATGTTSETARKLFTEISANIFYKPEMAAGYFTLLDTLKDTQSRHMMISGTPVFFYGGRALMKDFDILVPDEKIDIIGTHLGLRTGQKDSSVAFTRFVDVSPGVEINSDLMVKTPHTNIRFPFDFLWEEVTYCRVMGVKTPMMGLEDTILFKAALGRFGRDDWGKHKDDLSDIEGLIGCQNVNWVKLKSRARTLGMTDRLKQSLSRIQVDLDQTH